jgi:hypothetical protein|tara:strand:+ start:268 stop:927 length:660 start_codon:yes stop_codon:yes gene_type:complete
MSSNEVPIHELNSKLRTIDTNAKKLKTEYDAVAKRRGREMLTEYSNAYLRMENTNNYSGVASTSSSSPPFSLLVFPTEEENKAYSRAAALKRETAVLAWRAKLERDLRPKIERVREKFADLLEELHATVPNMLPKNACFSENFLQVQTNFLERHVAELDRKLSSLEFVLEKTNFTANSDPGRRRTRTHNNNTNENNSKNDCRNVLLVAIAAWFLEPKLP